MIRKSCQWFFHSSVVKTNFLAYSEESIKYFYFITCENHERKKEILTRIIEENIENNIYFKYLNRKYCIHCPLPIEVIDMEEKYRELHPEFYDKYTRG